MATDLGSDELSDVADGEHNHLKQLGKYRIERRIGAGGMGTVFLAVDRDLNRTVALKVLPKDRAGNPVLVRRFKAEGQAAAHMEHPNIVRVFEAGEADGFLYMALEYVEGIDVYELVERRGVVPVKRSIDIIRQTTEALQHAYEKGIVHRDIKPSNLLIKRDGSVKLADMGLARSVDDTLETNITRAGTTVGTVDYMSPEQARSSKSADVRSDIYSLGCTWYHMLTGHPPFSEGGMTNKLQAHAVSVRPDPRSENDRVPEGVVAIIQRMMACKPEDRYQTPRDLLEDLAAATKMHRTVDESALAALAGDVAQIEESDDEIVPMVRVGDIDEVDLASLRESAEFEVNYSPPKPIKSRSKKSKQRRQKGRPAPSTREQSSPLEDEPAADPEERAFSPIKPEQEPKPQKAARRSTPAVEDQEEARRTTKKKSRKQQPAASPSKSAKRGAVTKAGGVAADLPAVDVARPVDGKAGAGIDLDLLKVLIPAVLVVGALIGIGYAIMSGGDDPGLPGESNPYADGEPQVSGSSAAAGPADDSSLASPAGEDAPEPQPDETPQVAASDFPGAEEAPATTPDQLPLLPGWVEAFRQPRLESERTLRLRRRVTGSGQVATIREAISQLPAAGGTIEVDGDGPFPLEAISVSNRKRIRIQAAQGRRPVIHLRPGDNWTEGPLVDIRRSQVEFVGLHFVLVDAGPEQAELFAVRDGDASFRECSITVVRESSPHPLRAIRVTGAAGGRGAEDSGKCLIENTLIRGANLTAVVLDGSTDDLVVENCCFASGIAPAIVVSSRAGGAAAPRHRRGLRLLATTVISTQTGLELLHTASATPLDVIMRQALLVCSESVDAQGSSVMAKLVDWPAGTGGLGTQRLGDLTWQAEQSTFVGWTHLLELVNNAGAPLEQVGAQADAWRKFWNQGLRSDAVVEESFAAIEMEAVTTDALHARLSETISPLKEGQRPGYRPERMAVLPTGLIDHVVVAVRQPYEPEGLGQHMSVRDEPVRFDLGLRRSLARFIRSDACPDGTHIVAFGSGLKELDPILVENKSIRLQFENAEKSPLVIQPNAAREGEPADDALITVRNGTLDLVGAPLKLPASQRKTYPRSLVLLEDASLSLRQSTLDGPRVGTKDSHALIRWKATKPAAARSLLVEESFLVGVESLLAGPVNLHPLILRNSVLASASDAIVLAAPSPEIPPATLVIDHCTIASDGAASRGGLRHL